MSFIERLYLQFKNNKKINPYLRRVVIDHVLPSQVSVHLRGNEINPKTAQLIESAKEEILFQFYIYDNTSQAGLQIRDALCNLNAKNIHPEIKVRFLVDHRKGPAEWLTEANPYKFDWLLKIEDDPLHYAVVNRNGEIQKLDHLDIKYKIHEHDAFNSYHTKQIIVDKKNIMLRSGDICKDSNVYPVDAGWVQTATLIEDTAMAQDAAHSFHARFRERYSHVKPFPQTLGVDLTNANMMIIEKNPSYDPLKRLLFDAPFKIGLVAAINSAMTEIKILTSNLNDPGIVKALVSAVKRGVRVEILTGKYQFADWENKPTMGGTNEATVANLYQEIPFHLWDLLQIHWACNSDSNRFKKYMVANDNYEMIHGKVCIIDRCIVLAGSSPLDVQSSKYSAEEDCIIEDEEIAEYYINHIFNQEIKNSIHDGLNKLNLIKRSILADFKNIRIEELHFWQHPQYRQLSQQKVRALDRLSFAMDCTQSFKSIEETLARAKEPHRNNPFAQHRRHDPLNFFNSFGTTHTIKALERLYQIYVIGHCARNDIVDQYDHCKLHPSQTP